MPSCQAYQCANTSGKTPGKKSYFQFPDPVKEKDRAEKWLFNIGTGHTVNKFNFNKNKVVCSDHFHENCFVVDKIAEYLGHEPKKRFLKDGAIPTIFKYKTYKEINMNGEVITERISSSKRSQKREHDEVKKFHLIIFIPSSNFLRNFLSRICLLF